jgi:tRNA dimethylallyltransferase
MSKPVPIVIVGCTASGKSALAEALAEKPGARLMAVDSMQVYRGMNIGTAKPEAEARRRHDYLMLDVADAWDSYSAARFVADARRHLEQDGPLVLVAGTILYLRALLEGLFDGPSADAEIRAKLEAEAGTTTVQALHGRLEKVDALAASRIHPNDLRRIVRALEVFEITGQPISALQTQWHREHPRMEAMFIGIRREKESLNKRINARVKGMMAAGLLEEVRRLKDDPRGLSMEAASGVGYRQILDHFDGKCTLEDAVEAIKIQTRHLAKMQRTWLKRFPNVHWLDAADEQTGAELAERAAEIVALRRITKP